MNFCRRDAKTDGKEDEAKAAKMDAMTPDRKSGELEEAAERRLNKARHEGERTHGESVEGRKRHRTNRSVKRRAMAEEPTIISYPRRRLRCQEVIRPGTVGAWRDIGGGDFPLAFESSFSPLWEQHLATGSSESNIHE